MIRTLFAAFTALLAAGCASVDLADYRDQRPVFDFAHYFNGTIDGWGIFQDRSGLVRKRFEVRIDASWNGNEGTLDEHFVYSDGTTERRVWKLAREGEAYTGTAGDVVGTARGAAQGNAVRWRYVLALPVDGRTWHMDMDDWMYLIDERTVINRTTMSKFGIEVGHLTVSFRKR